MQKLKMFFRELLVRPTPPEPRHRGPESEEVDDIDETDYWDANLYLPPPRHKQAS